MVLLYRGKDVEKMNREELLSCVKALFSKLKDKHNIIKGLEISIKLQSCDNSLDGKIKQFSDSLMGALKAKKNR